MKLTLALAFVASASAFAPVTTRWAVPAHVALCAEADAARSAAEMATAKFGVTSPEAAAAWDTVDEVENKGYTRVVAPTLEEECAIDGADADAKCIEYNQRVEQLSELMAQASVTNKQIQTEISALQDISLSSPSISTGQTFDEAAYQKAKAEAEAATAEHGADSRQSRAAWDIVSEIESAGESSPLTTLADECMVEQSAKCADYQKALDTFQAILDQQRA